MIALMRFYVSFLLVLVAALPLQAQTIDQTFKDWTVFQHQSGCYIASASKGHTGTFRKRGQPYLMVVHKSTAVDEINASSGYPFAARLDAQLKIGTQNYKLYTQGNVAWGYDATQDAAIVAALKQGDKALLRGTSQRKTWSEDTYSLTGFREAYARMKVLCK